MDDIKEVSEAQTQCLAWLYAEGGIPVSRVPETSKDLPGRRVFQALIKKGLVYQADGWTQRNGTSHPASFELTYEGALMAAALAGSGKSSTQESGHNLTG